MKKIIFLLAFMLISSFSFASNLKIENDKSTLEIKEVKNSDYTIVVKKITDDIFCIEYHVIYFRGKIIGEFEVETYGVNGPCGVTIHVVKEQ